MMVPFRKIDPRAAFAAAFEVAGMPWMRVVVALGALLGIVTGVLVGMMAVARIFSAVGRSHLVFPVIGHVHPKYRTPAVRCGRGLAGGPAFSPACPRMFVWPADWGQPVWWGGNNAYFQNRPSPSPAPFPSP
jgi:hypothetical protein